MDADALAAWLPRYFEATVRLHHPGSMAHQVATPSTGAALADLVHGATNNPMAKYEMGAAGATIEREVVRWMLRRVGFAGDAGGVLTHGGSIANLTALLAARARIAPDAWRAGVPGDLALLAPRSVHYSITRAAAILGLGEQAVIELEVDELERIRPDRLSAALERCTAAGRRPLALVATAPATSTGLHDHLPVDRRVLRRSRDLVARRRRARRLGAAVRARPRPARRYRASRLGRLGRPQAAAHLGAVCGRPGQARG